MKDEATLLALNKAKWDEWANAIDGDKWKYRFLREAQARVLSLMDLRKGVRLLDVGCGTGWALGEAARRTDNTGVFYGVDLSTNMIERARERFRGRENFHFLVANAEAIPLDDAMFDHIICTNAFHHFPHPERAVHELSRLLTNEGSLFILDPIADTWLFRLIDRLVRLLEPEHVKLYSTADFIRFFHDAGLGHHTASGSNRHQTIQIGMKS